MDNFKALEKVLANHHARTSTLVKANELIERAKPFSAEALNWASIEEICRIWPEAYLIRRIRNQYYVGIDNYSPLDALRRQKIYAERLANKENLTTSVKTAECVAPIRVSGKGIVKGRVPTPLGKTKALSLEQLLCKVRTKKQELAASEVSKQEREKQFLAGHVPAVEKVLRFLSAKQTRSLSPAELIRRVSQSLPTSLSTKEIMDIVSLVAEKMPEFCQIVTTGSVTAVRLSPINTVTAA